MGRKAESIDDQTFEVLSRIENEDDPRIAWGAVKRRIETLREEGKDVPEALMLAERHLMTECMTESQGR